MMQNVPLRRKEFKLGLSSQTRAAEAERDEEITTPKEYQIVHKGRRVSGGSLDENPIAAQNAERMPRRKPSSLRHLRIAERSQKCIAMT